jgi:Spy/CpxP family protein refolding chaperone
MIQPLKNIFSKGELFLNSFCLKESNYSGSEGQRHIGTKCFASLLRYFFLCAFAPVSLCAYLSSYKGNKERESAEMKLKGKLKSEMLICLLVAISLSLTTAVYASSQGKYLGKDEPQGKRLEKNAIPPEDREAQVVEINQQLNLSTEQDRQLRVHRNQHEKQKEELNERIRSKKEELKQELQKQELRMKKINQLHAELKLLLGQREDRRLEGILEVRKILTPEQLKKFLELIERYHHGPEGKEQNREQSRD